MIVVLLTQSGIARDFSYTYEGQTLRYSVIDETAKTCEVAEKNKVTGELIIPSIAKDGDSEFTVTSIGEAAFFMCSGLTTMTIPNSVTSIGEEAFWACRGLTSVTIPNSVTSIGEYAFFNCKGLTKVIFGKSVNVIRAWAFSDCKNITDVVSLAEKIPDLSENSFTKNVYGNATLHVPGGSLNDYKTTSPWSLFLNIVGDAEEAAGSY